LSCADIGELATSSSSFLMAVFDSSSTCLASTSSRDQIFFFSLMSYRANWPPCRYTNWSAPNTADCPENEGSSKCTENPGFGLDPNHANQNHKPSQSPTTPTTANVTRPTLRQSWASTRDFWPAKTGTLRPLDSALALQSGEHR